jgi:DNA-binding PucR family transcriptional regulator
MIREDGMIAVTPVADDLLRERLRRTEHELRVLTRMSRLIGQLRPLRETLDQIATQVAELLGAPFCAILLSSPADGLLTIEGAYGLDREYIAFINANRSMRLDTLLGLPSGEVFRTGQPQVWTDVRNHPSFAPLREAVQHQGFISMVAVPLGGPDGVIGTLNCYRTSTQGFGGDEVALLATIASHTAIAIHNADLIDQLNTTVTRLSEANQTIQRQHAILARSEDIHRRLTRLVLEERGVQTIVETLAVLLDCGVSLYDHRLELIADSGAPSPGAPAPITLSHSAMTASALRASRLQTLLHLPAGPHVSAAALVAPITTRGKTLGYLVVADSSARSEEPEQRALEHAVTVCALELVKQRAAADAERRISGDFIGDVLAGRFASSEEILRRADYLGYDLAGPYRVLVSDVDHFSDYVAQRHLTEPQVSDLKQQLVDVVDQAARRAHPRAIVIPQSQQAVILLPIRAAEQNAGTTIAGLADALAIAARRSLPGLTLSMGVSAPVGAPIELGRGRQEALDALVIARNLDRRATVVTFDELGVYHLLLRNSARDDLLRFAHRSLDPLVVYDRRRSASLLPTLEYFLHHGRSPQRAASLLHVHPNTVKHRLQQARRLTGIDIDDTGQLFELQLALLIRRLVGAEFDASIP